jgi:hypothetical protein
VSAAHPTFQAGAEPEQWLGTAERLERAAALMPVMTFEEHRDWFGQLLSPDEPRAGSFITNDVTPSLLFWPVRMMLLGLALENLAKGLIVASRPPTIEASRVVYPWRGGHLSRDLLERDLGLTLTPTEQLVVDTLAEFVNWAGRFPAPREAPEVEQRWESELELVYWSLSRRLRVDLKLTARARHRVDIENQLRASHKAADKDGLVTFAAETADSSPRLEVACDCGSFFELSPRQPAVICLCGKLFHGRPKSMLAGGMRMDVDIYPSAPPNLAAELE